jgi:hypothetical protein
MAASSAYLQLFDVPLEVLHRILYEMGVLSPLDVLNFARTCRTAESAAFGAGAEREFNMVQLRAIADPVEMMRIFKQEAGPAFRLGLTRDLYSVQRIMSATHRIYAHFPLLSTPDLVSLLEKKTAGVRISQSLVAMSIAGGRTDLYNRAVGEREGDMAVNVAVFCFEAGCHMVSRVKTSEGLEVLSSIFDSHPEWNVVRVSKYIKACLACCRIDLFMEALRRCGGACPIAMEDAVEAKNATLLTLVVALFVTIHGWESHMPRLFKNCARRSARVGWLSPPELCEVFVEAGAGCDELKAAAFNNALGFNGQNPNMADLDALIEFYAGRE